MQQWVLYAKGLLDLAAVCIATDQAFQLARTLDLEARGPLMEYLESEPEQKQAAIKLIMQATRVMEEAAASVLSGNVYLPYYFWLLGSPQNSGSEDEYQLGEQTYYNAFSVFWGWHIGVCFMNMSSALLLVEEGKYGSHTYSGHWKELDVQQRREKSRAFLMETLPELHLVGRLTGKAPVQDELSRRVLQSVEEREVYLSTAFGLHLLLYIRNKLLDAGKLGNPLDTLRSFLLARAITTESLLPVLPSRKAQDTLRPIHRHMLEAQKDLFGLLKRSARDSGVVTPTAFFTLSRSPILCGVLLHKERIATLKAFLKLESNHGGLTGIVHLGNMLSHEGHIKGLGAAMGLTARLLHDKSFFPGGKRPTTKADYHRSYALAIGASAANFAPGDSRGGPGSRPVVRENKVEVVHPAPFSQVVYDRLTDEMGRFSLSEKDLVGMLKAGGDHLRKPKPDTTGQDSVPFQPLKRALTLLHAEATVLNIDHLQSLQVA
jgi:hypothetical protein